MKYTDYLLEIKNIVDSLHKNQLAVFCGAGATADATGITWSDLFKVALQEIDKDVNDCYKLAEYYQLLYGRSKLVNAVSNTFSGRASSKHIKHLLKLPIYEFWTTNFDCIIEEMIMDETKISPSVIYK